MHCLPQLDNLSLSGSFKLNQAQSPNTQKQYTISSTMKRSSISTPSPTASSILSSPIGDTPFTGVSIARHFQLPVVMEEDERSEDVGVKKSDSEGVDNNQQHIDASTQTSSSKRDDGDEDLTNVILRDVLSKYIPLPPSTTTTPSVSHCNLENY